MSATKPLELLGPQGLGGGAATDEDRVGQAVVEQRFPIVRHAQARQQALQLRASLRPARRPTRRCCDQRRELRRRAQEVGIGTQNGEFHRRPKSQGEELSVRIRLCSPRAFDVRWWRVRLCADHTVLDSRSCCMTRNTLISTALAASLLTAMNRPLFGAETAAAPGAGSEAKPQAMGAPDVAVLVQQLDSNRYREREQATQLLVEAGSAALDPLLAAANGDRPEAADRAVWVLRKLSNSTDRDFALAALDRLVQVKERPTVVADARQNQKSASIGRVPGAARQVGWAIVGDRRPHGRHRLGFDRPPPTGRRLAGLRRRSQVLAHARSATLLPARSVPESMTRPSSSSNRRTICACCKFSCRG